MKIIYIGIFTALLFTACHSERTQYADSPHEKPMVLSQTDTLAVKGLVQQFMDFAMNGRYDEAAAMLYEIDPADINQEPILLDNDQMQGVRQILRMFPVDDYEISRMTLKEAVNNEVECVIHFYGSATTKWNFKPVRYLGEWKLCMRNTLSGDKPFQ